MLCIEVHLSHVQYSSQGTHITCGALDYTIIQYCTTQYSIAQAIMHRRTWLQEVITSRWHDAL